MSSALCVGRIGNKIHRIRYTVFKRCILRNALVVLPYCAAYGNTGNTCYQITSLLLCCLALKFFGCSSDAVMRSKDPCFRLLYAACIFVDKSDWRRGEHDCPTWWVDHQGKQGRQQSWNEQIKKP